MNFWLALIAVFYSLLFLVPLIVAGIDFLKGPRPGKDTWGRPSQSAAPPDVKKETKRYRRISDGKNTDNVIIFDLKNRNA